MIYKKRKYNNNRTNINNLSLNETNSKKTTLTSTKESHYYSIIQDIYDYTYEDYFPVILTFKINRKQIPKSLVVLMNFSYLCIVKFNDGTDAVGRKNYRSGQAEKSRWAGRKSEV